MDFDRMNRRAFVAATAAAVPSLAVSARAESQKKGWAGGSADLHREAGT